VQIRNTVLLYRGYGANGKVWVHGRALEKHRVLTAHEHHDRWDNLVAMFQRADADPLRHASVRVSTGNSSSEFTADDEGFFSGWMKLGDPEGATAHPDWIVLQAQVTSVPSSAPTSGEAFYPQRSLPQLVISDIDDTVLQSRVTNFLRAAQTLAFGNARTRLPFPGVAAFYGALRRGAHGTSDNPAFYVSSSPWNLYDVITEFLDIQGIPRGPVMLRDLDIGFGSLRSRHHHDHKGANIRRILETYPDVPVILIGDSGQQDPEIYHKVVHDFPTRVRAIYIRNVTMNPGRSAAIDALAKEVLAAGASLVLADDTLTAAKHAVENGFISADALPAISGEKKADEGVTGTKADAPGARDAGDKPKPTEIIEEK
jgi:phosphatidate phosphatase APP1